MVVKHGKDTDRREHHGHRSSLRGMLIHLEKIYQGRHDDKSSTDAYKTAEHTGYNTDDKNDEYGCECHIFFILVVNHSAPEIICTANIQYLCLISKPAEFNLI